MSDLNGQMPEKDIQALGKMMADWLRTAMVDAGTGVDTGRGGAGFDLWCKFGGIDTYIHIRPSDSQLKRWKEERGEEDDDD